MDEEKMERLRSELIRRTKLERSGSCDIQAGLAESPCTRDSIAQLRRQSVISRLFLSRRSEMPLDDRRADLESLKYFFYDSPSGRSSESSLSSWDAPRLSLPLQKRLLLPVSRISLLQMPKEAVLAGGRIYPALEAKHPVASRIIETSNLRYKTSLRSATGRSSSSRRSRFYRRSGEKKGRQKSSRVSKTKMLPRQLSSCFSWAKSRPIRAHALHCLVAGLFLISVLAVYLGLSLNKKVNKNEVGIIMIVLTVLGSIWLCYAAMKLCILYSNKDRLTVGGLEQGSMDSNSGVIIKQPGP